MISRFITLSFILCSLSLFGMNAPEDCKTKKRKYKSDVLQFLENVRLNHATLENNYLKLLELNCEKESDVYNLVDQLRKITSKDIDIKVTFFEQLLEITKQQPAKKKQKIETTESSEKETSQPQKLEIFPALKRALLDMIETQQITAVTAQNNVNRITYTLEIIEGNNKQMPVPDLMYI